MTSLPRLGNAASFQGTQSSLLSRLLSFQKGLLRPPLRSSSHSFGPCPQWLSLCEIRSKFHSHALCQLPARAQHPGTKLGEAEWGETEYPAKAGPPTVPHPSPSHRCLQGPRTLPAPEQGCLAVFLMWSSAFPLQFQRVSQLKQCQHTHPPERRPCRCFISMRDPRSHTAREISKGPTVEA